MVNRRTASRTATEDDRAVAGVVGFVLILAAAVTYYSYAAQSQVPRIGADNEEAWDAAVGDALTRLAQSAGERVGTGASAREVIPSPPEAPTQTMIFLAPLRSARAESSLAYTNDTSSCGSTTLTHEKATITIADLVNGSQGCVTFRGETAYAPSFAYRLELGGLLRIQSDRAAVVVGPPLKVDRDHVALTIYDVEGATQTLGAGGADVTVSLTPRPSAIEVTSLMNADAITWSLVTSYPEAWRDWYQERFVAANVGLDASIVCANPGASGPARGPCTLTLEVLDPTSLAISYGGYDLRLA